MTQVAQLFEEWELLFPVEIFMVCWKMNNFELFHIDKDLENT